MLVQRVEEPLLDQASEDFRKDLAALLKKYLESHPSTKSPVKAPKRRIVVRDGLGTGGGLEAVRGKGLLHDE